MPAAELAHGSFDVGRFPGNASVLLAGDLPEFQWET